MSSTTRPGDVLAGRYRLVDLLNESRGGLFWRAYDAVLARHVALHVIDAEDERAAALLAAARRSATVADRRLLRVLDAVEREGVCYVVNEWGAGTSLDVMLAADSPLHPRRVAWIVSEVGVALTSAHAVGATHGRLNPENVLIDHAGNVRVIGFAVDAALHGLPEGRPSADVTDLAALLYAGLTGRWAGASRSGLPPAPQELGRVLRPRKVRAGMPRSLDELCDQVLNPESPPNGGAHLRMEHDLTTADGISRALRDFVGDASALASQEAARQHGPRPGPQFTDTTPDDTTPEEATSGDATPDDPADEPEAAADDTGTTRLAPPPEDTSAETSGAPPAVEPEPHQQTAEGRDEDDGAMDGEATEAGLPIFEESGDVGWVSSRDTSPAPPPPFGEPPERPLFAPDSPPGSRLDRARAPEDDSPGSNGPPPVAPEPEPHWPWDSGATNGTAEQGRVPGRSWLRLAGGLAAAVALLLAVLFAYQLGSDTGSADQGGPSEGATSATPKVTGEPVEITAVRDYDPQGEPGENPEIVDLAVDGDPATAWRTLRYQQDFGPGGLKSGLGLVLDLGSTQTVSAVDLQLVGEPTTVEVHVSDQPPNGPAHDEPAATATLGTRGTVELEEPARGRYVTVWLTSLPSVPGGFQAEVAEVAVRG